MKNLFFLEKVLFYVLILFLPTQLGLHFWPDFSYVLGIRIDYLAPTVYLTDILVGLLFITWLFREVRQKLQKESKIKDQKLKIHIITSKKYFSYLICIFTFSFLIFNILLSGRILGGIYNHLLKLSEMALLAYYTAKFIDLKKHFPKIILLLSAGVITESIIAIAQFLKQGSVGGFLYFLGERTFNGSTPGIANASLNGELVLRSYGTFPHPNVLAGYLLIIMILALFSLQFGKPKKEKRSKKQEASFFQQISSALILNSYFLIQVTSLVLGSIALFLSMSRVAILLWIIIVSYYFLQKTRKTQQSSNIRSSEGLKFRSSGSLSLLSVPKKLILIGVLTIFTLFFLSPLGARFIKITNTDEAILQRKLLIEKSLEMIKAHPLLGVGLGNFLPTLATIQKPLTLGLYLQPVHNIFLLVAAETGLIGLGIFIWFIWKTYQRIKKQELRIKEPLLIAFSAILILGLFDHYWLTLQQGQLLFAFILGLCWTEAKIEKL